MKEAMRYMTLEEQELYEKMAVQHNIKGYSPPISLMRCEAISKTEKIQEIKTVRKKEEKK